MKASDVAEHLTACLNLNGAKIIGDPDRIVSRISVPFHIFGDANPMITMADEGKTDCFLSMELIDYTLTEYVRDSAMTGTGPVIIGIGHFNLEEPVMRYMVPRPDTMQSEMPIRVFLYMQSGDNYSTFCGKQNELMMYNMPMQRNRTAVLLTALMIVTAGCTTAPAPSTEPAVPENEPVQTEDASVSDAYASYHALMEKAGVEGNYTAGVQRTYEMRYEDGSLGTYDLDGVIADDDDCIYLTQHIYSDGIQADIEGWYDGSRLYMTYNTVDYYEDMDRNAVRDVMLVKRNRMNRKESDLASVESKTQERIRYIR